MRLGPRHLNPFWWARRLNRARLRRQRARLRAEKQKCAVEKQERVVEKQQRAEEKQRSAVGKQQRTLDLQQLRQRHREVRRQANTSRRRGLREAADARHERPPDPLIADRKLAAQDQSASTWHLADIALEEKEPPRSQRRLGARDQRRALGKEAWSPSEKEAWTRRREERRSRLVAERKLMVRAQRPSRRRHDLAATVRQLLATDAPMVAGPWMGEVGFEVLYWIPLLRWIVEQGVPAERLIAVSRGGPRSWYRGLAGGYHDIFEMMTPDEFRERNAERNQSPTRLKQGNAVSQFEGDVVRQAAERSGLTDYLTLSPARIYGLLRPYTHGKEPIESLAAFSRYAPINPLPAPGYDWLPERFIAIKFYWNSVLKPSRQATKRIGRIIAALQEVAPVVSLDAGIRADNHRELQTKQVISTAPHLTPATNLEVQTQVLSRALAFVGTYGGTSYIASATGIPTFTLMSRRTGRRKKGEDERQRSLAAHIALGQRLASTAGYGPITCLEIEEAGVLERLQRLVTAVADGTPVPPQ